MRLKAKAIFVISVLYFLDVHCLQLGEAAPYAYMYAWLILSVLSNLDYGTHANTQVNMGEIA